jgi:hypothetical protein
MAREIEGEFDSAIEADIAAEIAEESEQSIWGQKSDVDWLAPATSVGEYNDMLAGDDCDCAIEDIEDLDLE